MKRTLILVPLLAAGMLGMSGCSSVQYGDATAVETVNTDFGSTDLQMIAEKMVDDMLASGAVAQISAHPDRRLRDDPIGPGAVFQIDLREGAVFGVRLLQHEVISRKRIGQRWA